MRLARVRFTIRRMMIVVAVHLPKDGGVNAIAGTVGIRPLARGPIYGHEEAFATGRVVGHGTVVAGETAVFVSGTMGLGALALPAVGGAAAAGAGALAVTAEAGGVAAAAEDGGVTYIFRPNGEFWTILGN